jgi:hypothetical protein
MKISFLPCAAHNRPFTRLITGQQGFTTTVKTAYGYDTMNRLTNVLRTFFSS